MENPQPALVLGGPTASGKSRLAVELARRIGGEIINADAFQLYNGLPILSAQPDAAERALAPHRLYGCLPLSEPSDVASYAAMAREAIRACWLRGRNPILVGGSGLYLRAVLEGLTPGLPEADPELRRELESQSLENLCKQLQERDPVAAQTVDVRNPRRVVRALEVCLLTGRPFSEFRRPRLTTSPVGIWLSHPRAELHSRIENRTAQMFEQGVVEEVRNAQHHLLGPTSKQIIGIESIASFLRGEFSESDAIYRITTATRQYARRQETWFRKETGLLPVPIQDAMNEALRLVRGPLSSGSRRSLH